MYKKFKWSWINASLVLYGAGLAFYMLRDADNVFWSNYFWCLNGYLVIVSLAHNFKKNKTTKEMSVLFFMMVFRILLMLYFIIGIILSNAIWMNSNIMFIIVLFISSFCGIMYYGKDIRNGR